MAATRPVRSSSDPALIPLGGHEGKPPFLLTRPVFVIGSRSSSRIHLVSSTVSKSHALMVRSNGGVYIRDLASRTKVIVNGKTHREADLHNGDELQIGRFKFRFRGVDVPRDLNQAATARLRVAGQELPVPIDQRVLLIGRRIVCDVHLLEESVSTAHAVIFEMDGQRYIRDLGSRTGTFVNSVSTHQHLLTPGDRIRIGETELTYELGVAMGAADGPIAASPIAELARPETPSLAVTEPASGAELDLLGDLEMPAEPDTVDFSTEVPAKSEPIELEPIAEKAVESEPIVRGTVAEKPVGPASIEVEPVAEKLPEPEIRLPVEPPAIDEIDEPAGPLAAPATEPPIEPDEAVGALETPATLDEPILPTPQALDLPLEPEPVLDIEPIGSGDAPPPAELSEIAIAEALAEPAGPASSEEPPIAEEVGEPPLPPRDQAIAATVIEDESDTRKPGRKKKSDTDAEKPAKPLRGKAAAIEARKLIEPPAEPAEEPLKPARGKGKKGPGNKLRGKPTPPVIAEVPPLVVEEPIAQTPVAEPVAQTPSLEMPVEPLAEAPIEPPGAPDAVEPIIVSEPALVEPADITPLGVVEPEIAEPDIVAPREQTDFERSEPSARGPLVEPLTAEPAAPPLSAEPVLQADVEALEKAPPIETVEPLTAQTDAELPSVVEEVSTPVTPLELRTIDLPSDSALPTPGAGITDNDLLELESLLSESEDRPAAEQDRLIEPPPDSPAAAQAEAPDTTVDEDLAVSPADLAPDPLAEQTPDTLVAAESEPTVEPDITQTQAGALAEQVRPSAVEKVEPAAESDIAQTQAGKLAERVKWMANVDNVIGGQPLHLPEAEPSALSERPIVDETRHGEITAPDTVGQSPAAEVNGHVDGHGNRDIAAEADRPAAQPRSLTSFEGLAHSPLREMDVFSTMSPPAEEELIDAEVVNAANGEELPAELRPRGTISGVFGEPIQPPAHRQRVRPELSGSIAPLLPPVRGEVSASEARRIRRKYVRRVSTLVGLMVLLIGGSAVTIYNVVGVGGNVEAKLRFANLSSLKQYDRNNFASQQLDLLRQNTTRQLARRRLNERDPQIPPGFLDDQVDYVKNTDPCGFSADDSEILLVRINGKDPSGDAARAFAMTVALYEQDGTLLDDARKQRQSLDELKNSIADTQSQLGSITDQINKLRLSGESAPSLEIRQQLDTQLSKTETDWNNAVAAVKSAEAELLRMKAAAPGSPADAPTTAPQIANDAQMLSLQQQLTDANTKLKASRESATKAAADARKNLDQTLAGFQKQVADAQGLAGNNPEFNAYIQTAQRLLETTKQLTDQLIHTQEMLVGKLTEFKDQLGDQMEKRRVDLWQSDKELSDLNERLAIATRKLNTALGTGLKKESEDYQAEVELTKSMIKARQDLLPGDAFYSDTIQRLQNIVDQEKKNIAENRAATETQLTQLQQAFTSSAVVEQLPEEQKQLAAALSQRLNDINAARKEYNQTVDAGAGDADEQIKSQAATLQASIEARQKQLAEANLRALQARQEHERLAEIDARESELTKLRATEINCQKIYFETQKQAREAQANAEAAKDTSDKLDGLIRQKGVLQADLDTKNNQISLRQSQVAAVIEPQKPLESDVVIRRGEDRRLLDTLIVGGGLLALFSGLILWTLHTAHLVAPTSEFQPADLQPAAAEPLPALPTEDPAEPEPASI